MRCTVVQYSPFSCFALGICVRAQLTWDEQKARQIQSAHVRIVFPDILQMLFKLDIIRPHPPQDLFRRLLIHTVRLVHAHPARVGFQHVADLVNVQATLALPLFQAREERRVDEENVFDIGKDYRLCFFV
jgi:hypothetical protein